MPLLIFCQLLDCCFCKGETREVGLASYNCIQVEYNQYILFSICKTMKRLCKTVIFSIVMSDVLEDFHLAVFYFGIF